MQREDERQWNFKKQGESERFTNESEEQRIVGSADTQKQVSERIKNKSKEGRNITF